MIWKEFHLTMKDEPVVGCPMITLYSYPGLFGVADNNPYGLKVFAFLRLSRLSFRHAHVLDPKDAPRGQLPYITDDRVRVGDSDAIVAHLIKTYRLRIEGALSASQKDTHVLIRRLLDDLYWVMSYSRWADVRFWPLFRDEFARTHSEMTAGMLEGARAYNLERYHYQGIGRYDPSSVYARGVEDLRVLANLLPASGYVFGEDPGSIDAAIYGFIANIYFYEIETPLKTFVVTRPNLVQHCNAVHAAVSGTGA